MKDSNRSKYSIDGEFLKNFKTLSQLQQRYYTIEKFLRDEELEIKRHRKYIKLNNKLGQSLIDEEENIKRSSSEKNEALDKMLSQQLVNHGKFAGITYQIINQPKILNRSMRQAIRSPQKSIVSNKTKKSDIKITEIAITAQRPQQNLNALEAMNSNNNSRNDAIV